MRTKLLVVLAAIACGTLSMASARELRIISPQQQLTPLPNVTVAIHGDLALVGFQGLQFPIQTNGFVNIYERTSHQNCNISSCWAFVQRLTRPDGILGGDRFGTSLAVHDHTLVIGSPGSVPGSESVFVYRRNGQEFVMQQKLTGDPGPNPGESSNFGGGVVLAGNRLGITQARFDTLGAAYVFVRDNDDIWQREAKLVASGATDQDQYAISMGLTDNEAIVGASVAEYAKAFTREGAQWVERQTLMKFDDPIHSDDFGLLTDIQGQLAAIGAAETAFLFELQTDGWSPVQRLERADDAFSQNYGRALMTDDRIAVLGDGGIYVFEEIGELWENTIKLVNASRFIGHEIDGATVIASTDSGVWIYDLEPPGPSDNVVLEAEQMDLSGSYFVEEGLGRIFIADSGDGHADKPFPGSAGTYDIEVQLISGATGLSCVELYRNFEYLGFKYFDFSTATDVLRVSNVPMQTGDFVLLAGNSTGDSGARIDKIVFTRK